MHVGIKTAKPEIWDTVVIGAGLGGLTCAAYLAREGHRVLLLERASVAGGACQTYFTQGARFSIGTNTFGNHCARLLKELGVPISFDPAPLCLSYSGTNTYFPFRWSLMRAARKLGIGLGEVFRLIFRLKHVTGEGKTYADAVEGLTKVRALQELLLAESWYIGTPPEILTSRALRVFFDRSYGYQNPIYPTDGAQAVPEALLRCITQHGGEIKNDTRVNALIENQDGTWSVDGAGMRFQARRVVSNLSPQATLNLLRKGGHNSFEKEWMDQVHEQRPALSFAAFLFMLDRKGPFAKEIKLRNELRSSTLILASPVAATMQRLQAGEVPERPIVNVVAPACLDDGESEGLPVAVLTLYPQGGDSSLGVLLQSAVSQVLEEKWPGFSDSVKWSEVLTPEKYESILGGISSCPAHVMEDNSPKMPCAWPTPGLFSVGTTAGPSGSHAGAAMESGRICAKVILSSPDISKTFNNNVNDAIHPHLAIRS